MQSMNRWWLVLSTVVLTVSWPTLGFSQFPHPEDTGGQAAGRPEMRDPYGFDKDREREETGNQGRPIDAARGETPPAAKLPAPETVDAQFANGWFGAGQQPISKILTWSTAWCHHVQIVGFRVYQQGPGESRFSPYVTLYMKPDGLGIERSIQHTGEFAWTLADYGFSGWGMLYDKRRILVVESRDFSKWTLGSYRHYIVPIDAAGREGPSSPIQACTLLEKIQILHPKAGEVFNAQEVAAGKQHLIFEWSDVRKSVPGAGWVPGTDLLRGPYGVAFLQIDEIRTAPPSNARPGATPPPQSLNKGFFFGSDGTQWDYYYYGTSPKLAPGSDYRAQFVASYLSGRPEEKSLYGKCFAISEPVIFTVAPEPKPEPPKRTAGSVSNPSAPQPPTVRREETPQVQQEAPKPRQPQPQCLPPQAEASPIARRQASPSVAPEPSKRRDSPPPAPPQPQVRRSAPAPQPVPPNPPRGRR